MYKGSQTLQETLNIYNLLTQKTFTLGKIWFFYVQPPLTKTEVKYS